MEKKVLGLDFDDVVNNFNKVFYAWHNQYYGTKVLFIGITSYNICQILGISERVMRDRVERFIHQYHHEIKPAPGVCAALMQLSDKFELHMITSRCESLQTITHSWLTEYKLNSFAHHHFTNGFNTKHPERTRKKLDVCKEIGAVCLVEDAPKHCIDVASGGVKVLMPIRPWNRDVVHELVVPCSGWKEITDHLLKL
jgi:uncharacterized HAD superfamily protein